MALQILRKIQSSEAPHSRTHTKRDGARDGLLNQHDDLRNGLKATNLYDGGIALTWRMVASSRMTAVAQPGKTVVGEDCSGEGPKVREPRGKMPACPVFRQRIRTSVALSDEFGFSQHC